MSEKLQLLVGAWEPEDADSRGVFEIGVTRRGFKVRAWDRYDGEEFVVSKTRVKDGTLTFETFVPSSKWRTRNVLKPISRTRMREELTIWDSWRRVRSGTPDQDNQQQEREPQAQKIQKNAELELLVGRWEVVEDDSIVAFEIIKTQRGLKVRAFNKFDGEEFVVSKTRVNNGTLSFETFTPSSKFRAWNSLKPTSKTRLIQELTYWVPWRRVQANPEDLSKQPPYKEPKRQQKIQQEASKDE